MKKISFIHLIILFTITGCKEKPKEQSIPEVGTKTIDLVEVDQEPSNQKRSQPFNWNDIQESTVDIGAYPYISSPKGMVIDKEYSTSYEFDKLEFFNGYSFFLLDGKVERLKMKMTDDKAWQEYYFQKSVSDYLKSIGAQLLFDGQIPTEFTQNWGADPNSIYEHMHEFYATDVVNQPVSFYVLKTPSQKIGFQIGANSQSIGVVEYENLVQTIEKLTADEILNAIEKEGVATLYINFDTGKSRIKATSYEVIAEVVKMMKNNPNLNISIEGHTDATGDTAANLKLSKNRAQSVLLALTDEDVDISRLQSKGFGQTKPIGANNTEEGKAKNRRVELRKI
ncbi:hypothetical protein MTsPCn9_10170 [Croceitalea sp. MTPC9]|uniref:OmpA family protein n=1 Tax=unclassified Croceitalea TaxID=2632280 RepID=UPI002B375CF6|nr:hypothetical protein MTsPCn6_27070 [Croceitalea sp. MTPC6]GMN16081.1 hypothetical protein MTsPCn9_10170 [Croceitalea sp. MTPC9]